MPYSRNYPGYPFGSSYIYTQYNPKRNTFEYYDPCGDIQPDYITFDNYNNNIYSIPPNVLIASLVLLGLALIH